MIQVSRGNCLKVLPHLAPGSVDMVFADLPYGVTANRWDVVIPFAPLWEQLLRVGKKNCAFVFTATQPFATALINSQPKLFRYDLIWHKSIPSGFLNANKMPLRAHENLLLFACKLPTYCPQKTPGKPYTKMRQGRSTNYGKGGRISTSHDGARHPVSVLYVPQLTRPTTVHPTQKPVALMEWLIKTYSNPGDTILDPTMGSGTTGVACVTTGRSFHGIELDATYYRTAKRRIREAMRVP